LRLGSGILIDGEYDTNRLYQSNYNIPRIF